MSRRLLTILACITALSFGNAHAAVFWSAGALGDISSNMLQYPDGRSGVMTSLYGDTSYAWDVYGLSYGFETGFFEYYQGIQYHTHKITADRFFFPGGNEIDVAVSGRFTRYGDVTAFEGYDQIRGEAGLKRYLNETLLLRSRIDISARSYREYTDNNYTQVEGYCRLDRFFPSGMTLRGQFDAGFRIYESDRIGDDVLRIGGSLRCARSVGEHSGLWCETSLHQIDGGETDTTLEYYDFVFVDDRYQYSSIGVEAGARRRFISGGEITVRAVLREKDFGNTVFTAAGDIPYDGWKEREWGMYIDLQCSFNNLPDRLHPALELYALRIDADYDDLSYDTVGMTLRLDVF